MCTGEQAGDCGFESRRRLILHAQKSPNKNIYVHLVICKIFIPTFIVLLPSQTIGNVGESCFVLAKNYKPNTIWLFILYLFFEWVATKSKMVNVWRKNGLLIYSWNGLISPRTCASVAQWIRHRPPSVATEQKRESRGLRVRVPPEVDFDHTQLHEHRHTPISRVCA